MISRTFRLTILCFISILGLGAIYVAAAIVGAIWTQSPNSWDRDAKSITIYLYSNGFHSDVIIPFDLAETPRILPITAEDFDVNLDDANYLAIGWGSRTAYTSLLDIKDMSLPIIAKSLFLDQSVIHVQPLKNSPQGDQVHKLQIDGVGFQNLLNFINKSFSKGSSNRGILLPNATHGFGDIFYKSDYRYHPLFSCNVWTGDALRAAGVAMGYWTPFAQSLEWAVQKRIGGN